MEKNMSANAILKTIIQIPRDDLDQAVEVLALAFENGPLIRYLLPHQGSEYFGQIRELFRFTCEIRLDLGWPLIGILSNTQLTGVTCISLPESKKWPTSLVTKHEKFKSIIGTESVNRRERFSNLTDQYVPSQSHYYLAAIGIHPNFQKQSLGSVLLNAVHDMSEVHPASTGVFLETANPVNVPLYEHFGYHLVSKVKLDNIIDIWYMFRPNNVKN